MKLHIKYMVSMRCKNIVKAELQKLRLHFTSVDLGEVEILEHISKSTRSQLKVALKKNGLELMDDKKNILIERIKNAIVEVIHYSEDELKVNFSEYLSQKLCYDYNYLSNLFTEVQGTTIEKFIIQHKIERVKELIVYDELSMSEIAYKLHYSSAAHLSNQFKRITGLTPSHFKQLKEKKLINLEDIK
ncbi:MAG: AraC family transcriptional regulator [Ignavibacteria bacterium]|nr:AraC family transcriptional regulator [Ignavibacteria bacterium]MBK6875611.1 AraC family transcriptional regulator [Ignavibacteria bacterium]MBK9226248.1 AraC family transcriptional regulator [Ignavibacteria bacterium]